METKSNFVQGIYSFTGAGLDHPAPLGAGVVYMAPEDRRAQLIYFRAGNSADALISIALIKDGTLMRLFPIGAKSAMHVSLAVVDDIFPGSRIEVVVAAPAGVAGQVVIDIGLIEI